MIVLDASATLSWLMNETDDTGWVEIEMAKDETFVPSLWRLEVAHVLLKKERQKLLSLDQRIAYARSLDELDIEIIEPDPDTTIEAITQFARPHQLSAYDAAYLQLAVDLNASFLTFDNNLKAAANRIGVEIVEAL